MTEQPTTPTAGNVLVLRQSLVFFFDLWKAEIAMPYELGLSSIVTAKMVAAAIWAAETGESNDPPLMEMCLPSWHSAYLESREAEYDRGDRHEH